MQNNFQIGNRLLERTKVVKKRTGKVLGYCDVVPVGTHHLVPYYCNPDGEITTIKFRYSYDWEEKKFVIIAHGMCDAKLLHNFSEDKYA